MRIASSVVVAAALALVSATTGAMAKPHVAVVATGGTIAGAQTAPQGGGYTSGVFSVETLIAGVPQLKEIAEISGEQLVKIGSQDMSDAVWLKLAKRVNELLASNDVDAVVITHGTDTMEETAYFLDLVVKSDKPVVLVGSMRPATAVSADGPGNLYDAVTVAADPQAKGRGVMVVLNDQVFAARDVYKTNTTQVDTFKSPDRGPIGSVEAGTVVLFEVPDGRHTTESEFSVDDIAAMPKVDIVYAYANMGRELIDAAVKAGAKGIVVAGVGNGNMTAEALQALSDAHKKGVVIVRSTRLPSGFVTRNAEVDDDALGFVASEELKPSKARVLLKLALMKTTDPLQIQEMFRVY
ncbi:MAG: type II asparaginase [Rhodospirillales bacterium]|nr:type II asparaginase [Rhodospirillales bacterium]